MRTLACGVLAAAAWPAMGEETGVNPIRKVVTMLQRIQQKVEAEGVTAEGLFKKFSCYCSSSGGALKESIASSDAKVPELASAIEQAETQVVQLAAELKKHIAERTAAKDSISEGNAIRVNEAAAFASVKKELDTNLAAIGKAVAALEKGAGMGFVQTEFANVLRNLLQSNVNFISDREVLMSFLDTEHGQKYTPVGGEVTGILKKMGDELGADLAAATEEENARIESHAGLIAAKKKEIAAATKAIEEKMSREGETKVKIAEMKADLDDTSAALLEDKKFLADLETKCSTAQSDYDKACKSRSMELLALADTIKLLNSDDALELFKKALPGPKSFLQGQVGLMNRRARALDLLRSHKGTAQHVGVDFITLALDGKKVSFEKVIGMIDAMVETLKREQVDDVNKKEYCNAKLDSSDETKKGLERSISHTELVIADAQDFLKTVTDEIVGLETGIAALDKSVAEAASQRKEEHAAYVELIAEDTAARKLLGLAKNRLNKFYNPALHKPEAALTSVAVKMHAQDAPPPAPELPGAHEKKMEESNGVIAQLDTLVADLDEEMQVAKTEKKNANADYAKTVNDAAAKRADDVKALNDKKGAKADTSATLQEHTDELKSQKLELGVTLKIISGLHGECDWLVKYFDVRKDARDAEVDSLKTAKSVLKGADYSFAEMYSLRGGRKGVSRSTN